MCAEPLFIGPAPTRCSPSPSLQHRERNRDTLTRSLPGRQVGWLEGRLERAKSRYDTRKEGSVSSSPPSCFKKAAAASASPGWLT